MSDQEQTARSRRDLLKSAILGGSAALVGASGAHADEPTPSDAEGPFYPDIDNDLTFVARRDKKAKGEVMYVHGVVKTTDGKPIERALVEIWQTDHQGIYDHAGDRRHKDKDKNFQSFGRAITDAEGRYAFKTIHPVMYGAGDFVRTPHIHYKVWCRGYNELTTQMYFKGEKRNATDGLYNQLSKKEQPLVTVAFAPAKSAPKDLSKRLAAEFKEKDGLAAEAPVGEFNLVLAKVHAPTQAKGTDVRYS